MNVSSGMTNGLKVISKLRSASEHGTGVSPPAYADGIKMNSAKNDESGHSAVIITWSGILSTFPSFTTSWTKYWPGKSTINVGDSKIRSSSSASLPSGVERISHWNDNESLSGSLLPVPSKNTISQVSTQADTFWSGPALAIGGLLTPISAVPDNWTLNPAIIPKSSAINSSVLIPGWNPDVIISPLKRFWSAKDVRKVGKFLPLIFMASRPLSTATLTLTCAVEGSNPVKSNVVLNVHFWLRFWLDSEV